MAAKTSILKSSKKSKYSSQSSPISPKQPTIKRSRKNNVYFAQKKLCAVQFFNPIKDKSLWWSREKVLEFREREREIYQTKPYGYLNDKEVTQNTKANESITCSGYQSAWGWSWDCLCSIGHPESTTYCNWCHGVQPVLTLDEQLKNHYYKINHKIAKTVRANTQNTTEQTPSPYQNSDSTTQFLYEDYDEEPLVFVVDDVHST